MIRIRHATIVAMVLSLPAVTAAGPVNPDISVIGDVRADWNESRDDVQLEFHELEIAFVGALNPYASAEVFVAVHGLEEVEIEEAKMMLDRYFPGGFGVTVGQKYLDFGQINQVHTHAYPFIRRPLIHSEFFGEDGARDVGARLDWLAPPEAVTIRASLGAVRGDVFLGGHGHDQEEDGDEDEHAAEPDPEIGVTGRLELFAELGKNSSFLVGSTVMHGKHDPVESANVTWIDVDAKLQRDLGPYRALVVVAEGVFGKLDATDEIGKAEPNGWFAAADFRASRRWNVGAFGESATERTDDSVTTTRYGGFLGLALMEETTLFRLMASSTDPDEGDRETDVILQAIFGLGPHRPHRY